MSDKNKYYETGSNPYYLNMNSTAKDFSFQETTNPKFNLLNLLSDNIIINDNIIDNENPTTEQPNKTNPINNRS